MFDTREGLASSDVLQCVEHAARIVRAGLSCPLGERLPILDILMAWDTSEAADAEVVATVGQVSRAV